MARPARFLARLTLGAALVAAGTLAGLAWIDRTPARDLIPADAPLVVEALDAAGIAGRIEGTRFAAAFAGSATLAWIERTDAVAALDQLRADVKRVTGIPLGRGAILDVVGGETAVAWYPGSRPGDPERWVAVCRLSLRAWAAAGVLRAAERAGFGGGVTRERIEGRDAYAFPDGEGRGLHLLFVRRLLVAGSDAGLVRAAARCADGSAAPVTASPSWAAVRRRLPPRGAIFAWARSTALPGAAPAVTPGSRAGSPPGAAGILVTAGNPAEIHFFAEQLPAAPGAGVLPALPLLGSDPLFFHAGSGAPPPLLSELLRTRERAAAGPGQRAAALSPGGGYAIVVTEAAGGSSLVPLPRGLVAVGMPDPARAREALVRLFPPGARGAPVAGTTALSTRESIPLAGEIELWGAAVGSTLLFATGTDLIAAAAGAAPAPETAIASPGWRVDSVSSLAMDKMLPLLRRAAPPLSGILAARYPGLPDLARDIGLLGAVRSARLTAGADGEGTRALATVRLRDLP